MSLKQKKTLIVIVGPTAVGKTKLCVDIAQRLQTEIIYADSRQIYRDMAICTAQPTAKEMGSIKHHLINFVPITKPYTASTYTSDALKIINNLFKTHNSVVLSGGTGLYIDSVCEGLDDMPSINYHLRNLLTTRLETEGLQSLVEELKLKDPLYYEVVDKKNPRRILRALEVIYISGKTYWEHRTNHKIKRDFKIIKIGLNRTNEDLRNRINLRVDLMMQDGLIEETKKLYDYRNYNSTQTIGCKELFNYFENKTTLDEAILKIKKNTKRYAKRQMTWLKKNQSTAWYLPTDTDDIFNDILQNLSK